MPLESPDQQHLQAAVGYSELGMFAEADAELDEIDPFCRALPEVLAARLGIYRGLQKWELMQEISKRLWEFEPENVQWTISLAFATRRAYSIDTAMEILQTAQAKFPKEGAIPYNLACYHCQLGEIGNSKWFLKQAFEIDPTWAKSSAGGRRFKTVMGFAVKGSEFYRQCPEIQTQPAGRRTQCPATQTAAGLGRAIHVPGTQTYLIPDHLQ